MQFIQAEGKPPHQACSSLMLIVCTRDIIVIIRDAIVVKRDVIEAKDVILNARGLIKEKGLI